jgi:hypothetical protein
MFRRTLAVAGLVAMLSPAAFAQETTSTGNDFLGIPDGELSAAIKLGTLGIGGELGYRPFEMFGARIDTGNFSFSDSFRAGRTEYNATANLQSYGALADLYPFGESFRVTAGLRLNENDIRGNSTNQNLRFDNLNVPSAEIGNIGAKITFDKLSPYVGFGWGGTLAPGLNLTTDFGVMFHGNPKSSVNANLTPTGQAALGYGGAAAQALLNSEVASDGAELQHYVNGYDFYPVIEIGLSYKF